MQSRISLLAVLLNFSWTFFLLLTTAGVWVVRGCNSCLNRQQKLSMLFVVRFRTRGNPIFLVLQIDVNLCYWERIKNIYQYVSHWQINIFGWKEANESFFFPSNLWFPAIRRTPREMKNWSEFHVHRKTNGFVQRAGRKISFTRDPRLLGYKSNSKCVHLMARCGERWPLFLKIENLGQTQAPLCHTSVVLLYFSLHSKWWINVVK